MPEPRRAAAAPTGPGTVLAVAACSARALAEAAAEEGHAVLALDLFGDADTCAAARAWWPIGHGQPVGLAAPSGWAGDPVMGDNGAAPIAAGPLCAALQHAAQQGAVGWIAGGGFEADIGLLDAGAALLPLIGNPAAVWRAVRDPAEFFGVLHAAGLPHPDWQFNAPAPGEGEWLHKCSASSGGSAVQPWASRGLVDGHALPGTPALAPGVYHQRQVPGRPVSVSFLANAHEVQVLGFNEQRVRALPGQPWAFAGVVGPVPLPAAAQAVLQQALARLVPRFGLRGLGSLDAMLDGEQVWLLELNPRPSASLQLYPRCGALGSIDAHLQACLQGRLPGPAAGPAPRARPVVRGLAIVHAPVAVSIDAATAARLATWPGAQDLPLPGTRIAAHEPLCSLSVAGDDAAAVHAQLDTATARLLASLWPASPPPSRPAPETPHE